MTPQRPPTRSRPSLARRALPAIALTSASGFLLSVLDRPSTIVDAGSETSSGTGGTGGTDVVSITPAATATTAAPPDTAPAVTVTAETVPATVATVATTVAETAPATVATTVPAVPTCTTYNGPTVSTKWGPVQVQASVAPDGTICWSDAIVTPDSKSKSVQINNRAVPVLNERAVAAQGTAFDGISGATITADAYKQSLQAIIDAVVSGQVAG
jgi:uncharacterized protein with FMN-binding domain